MYDVPGDCVLTYDPEYVDFHSESTDFEDSHIPRVSHKNGYHSLLDKRKLYKRIKDDRSWSIPSRNSQISNDCSSKEIWESELVYNQPKQRLEIRESYHNRKSKTLDSGDQIETIKSKRSLIRHKVIPCISGMFKRSSNNVKQMSIIKENQASRVNKDNGCQTCQYGRDSRMRKFNRRQQCYVAAVRPVFAVEGNGHTQINRIKPHRTPKRDYTRTLYSLTSSSDVDRIEDEKIYSRQWNKRYDIATDSLDKPLKHSNNKQQQVGYGLLKRRRKPIQVYTSPYQYQWNNNVSSPGSTEMQSGCSGRPSICSGFWEYLCNKINNNKKVEDHRTCNCCLNAVMQNQPPPLCPYMCNRGYPPPVMPMGCPCNMMTANAQSPGINSDPQNVMNRQLPTNPPPRPQQQQAKSSKSSKPPPSPPYKYKHPKKVECECAPFLGFPLPSPGMTPPHSQGSTPPQQLQPQGQSPDLRPCQMAHDNLASSVAKKYNGEILCIHNPPCILINGCLSLPPPKEEQNIQSMTTTAWPVLHENKNRHLFRKKRDKKPIEQCYQYQNPDPHPQWLGYYQSFQNQVPADEGRKYNKSPCDSQKESRQSSEQKREKNIQSFCVHRPPCEVKWTCQRPKQDCTLPTSCVHVPVCENVPRCMLQKINKEDLKSCRHKPKCPDVPLCSQRYMVLTANEEAGTQVRPKTKHKVKQVCRHEPPCIMIPNCLARQCVGSYIPYEAIPDCVHQPMCEMIPACCRKSPKGMVSVCSQHPKSCRIV